MKTLRLIGTGLFICLLGLNLVACSDDDDDETPTTTKRLVQFIEEDCEIEENQYGNRYEDRDFDTYYFNYDNQGRLASITIGDELYTIGYSENLITCTFDKGDDGYESATFRLSDGRIISGKEENPGIPTYTHSYTYTSGHLSETRGELGYMAFTWSEDKLIGGYKDVDKHDYSYSLEYSGNTCNGYNPAIVIMLASDIMYEAEFFPIITNPELAGFKTNQLPKSMIEDDEVTNFTYEFDDDGYLRKCKAAEDDGDYTIYTFTWE